MARPTSCSMMVSGVHILYQSKASAFEFGAGRKAGSFFVCNFFRLHSSYWTVIIAKSRHVVSELQHRCDNLVTSTHYYKCCCNLFYVLTFSLLWRYSIHVENT